MTLAASQSSSATLRVPLPDELRETNKLMRAAAGKSALPVVTLPCLPLPGHTGREPLGTAVLSHTGPFRARAAIPSTLVMSPATFTICNCHETGNGEVYRSASRKMKHSSLPALSATMFTVPVSGKVTDLPENSSPPFVLPDVCAVVHPDATSVGSHVTTAPGQHVFSGDTHDSLRTRSRLIPFLSASGDSPPSAGNGMYAALIPGSAALTLRLPPSVMDETPLTLAFMNAHPAHTVEVYWVDYDGQLVLRRVLRCASRLAGVLGSCTPDFGISLIASSVCSLLLLLVCLQSW
jgi:hypothetical protein